MCSYVLVSVLRDNNAETCRSYVKACMNYRIVHLLVLHKLFYFIKMQVINIVKIISVFFVGPVYMMSNCCIIFVLSH